MVQLSDIVSQDRGFYFITYRSHPYSNESFSYINSITYAQSSHHAHSYLKQKIRDIPDNAVSYDLGVGICVPLNTLIQEEFDVSTLENIDSLDTQDVQERLEKHKPFVSKDDIIEVANRQEKIDTQQMDGSSEDTIITVDKE